MLEVLQTLLYINSIQEVSTMFSLFELAEVKKSSLSFMISEKV